MIYYPDTWIVLFKKKQTNKKQKSKKRKKGGGVGQGDFYSPVWLRVGMLVAWTTGERIHGHMRAHMCTCAHECGPAKTAQGNALLLLNPLWTGFRQGLRFPSFAGSWYEV